METTGYKALSRQQEEELLTALTTINDINFNALKAAEEAMETGELLIKTVTKVTEYQPTDAQLAEEIGDLIFRLGIFATHRGIMDEVGERIDGKAALLYEAFKAGKIGSTVTVNKTVK